MENFIWFISHFSCRIAIVLLGIPDALWLFALYDAGKLKPYIHTHYPMLIVICIITVISSIVLAIIGGKAGYKYVDMGRSRHWLYRSTAFSRCDNTLENVLYWSGKFALFPIVFVLLVFFIVNVILILKYNLIIFN